MIKYIKILLQIGLLVFIAAGNPIFAAEKQKNLDSIVAIINESIITQNELNKNLSLVKKQLQSNNIPLPSQDVLRKQVLDQIINKKLQMILAEQMGVKISDEDVEKTIKGIATNNKMTVNELYDRLGEQGMNAQQYRKEIRDQLVLHHAQQQAVASKISITPQEVDDFMRSKAWQAFNTKEYHLEDILIALPETPSSNDVITAKKRADQVLAKINRGMNFSEAAVAESGEENALQGGDLGWRKLPEIPSAFAEKIIDMKPKEITEPIRTQNGFHIIRLVEVRSIGKQLSSAEQKQQVQRLIFQRKFEESLQDWIMKLRGESFIKYQS